MRCVFGLILTAAVMFSIPSPALAARKDRAPAVQPPSVSVTPTVSGILFGDGEGLATAPSYGIKVGYDINGRNIADSLGIEGTFNYFSTKSAKGAGDASGYIYRLDAVYPFTPGAKWVPFVAAGLGGITIKSTSTEKSPLINYGAGIKYFLEDYLAVRVDARHLIVYHDVNTRNDFELGVGLTYVFGKERKKPLPPAVKPKEPVRTKPVEDPFAEPAPEFPPLSALEKLGIAAGALLGLTPEYEPPRPPLNRQALAVARPNGEGTASKETAPEVAAPKGAPPKETAPEGRPEATAPKQRAAVATPGPPLYQVNRNIVLHVEFDIDKDVVKPQYAPQIKEFARLLKASSYSSVVIEGHTDSTGRKGHNGKLSLRRAQAVKQAIAGYGARPKQITLKGYGPDKPVADNVTAQGKQRNRRTTATIVVTARP